MFETSEVKTVELERYKNTIQQVFPDHDIIAQDFEVIWFGRLEEIKGMGVRLCLSVMAEKLESRSKNHVFVFKNTVPATRWDYFKHYCLPGFLNSTILKPKYREVVSRRTRKVYFRKLAVYPQLPMIFPKAGKVIFKESMIADTSPPCNENVAAITETNS